MLTLLIEMFLNRGGSSSKAAAAGACVLVIMQYMWVFIFGSTEQSSVHGTVYGLQPPMASHVHLGNDMHQQHQYQRHLHHQSSASAITASAVSVPVSPQSPQLQEKQEPAPLHRAKSASAPVQHAATPKAAVAKDEVKALHTYRANPNDPNELSFEKDELIEILDRRGNWWQAKKHNGAIGIVPSNYFTP
ncbi:predicted protein [Lichtheimia corymbifera JMRC:FSU:9682]|uniref:SH3 domain-containing protein n=1 Tax=Lichtheimia corymbifera JMRC:FSU:9682 TaxID=1263082 RepID=A0A068RGF1_9FUNG|nr:predicted protein [Lichtheimia corymbifera JMRC:FSU:9682]